MTPTQMAALHNVCFVHPRPWSSDEFSALLAGAHVFWRANEAGFYIGQIMIDEAELLTLAVDPEQQRKGYGQRLLSAFHRDAADKNARESFLEVAADNTAGRALYDQAGYTQAGKRAGYYRTHGGTRIDALILRKVLESNPR